MSKLNLTLAALAVVQIVILVVLKLSGSGAAVGTLEARDLLDFDVKRVAGIEITNSEDEQTIRIAKKGDGWVLASSDDYPVKSESVVKAATEGDDTPSWSKGLLEKLDEIEVRRPIVRKADNHAPMKVADETFERRVKLTDKDGAELATVYLARGARSRFSYVRRGGQDEVYESDELQTWDLGTTTSTWVDLDYTAFDVANVESFSVALAEGTSFAFERRAEAAAETPTETPDGTAKTDAPKVWWMTAPVEAKANKTKVEDLLRKVVKARLSGIAGKTAPADGGFDKPAATYVVRFAKPAPKAEGEDTEPAAPFVEELTFQIGAKADDKDADYYAKASTSPYWVKIASWNIKPALELKLDELKAETPPEKPVETPIDEELPGEDG